MTHEHAGRMIAHPYWRGAATFAILAGAAIIAIWLYLFASGGVPELQVQPAATWTRIVTEIITALLLLAAGFGLLTRQRWARRVYLIAVGALLFAVVHAVATYGERGQIGMVLFFLALAIVSVFFAIRAEE
jgi:hypothetical protein